MIPNHAAVIVDFLGNIEREVECPDVFKLHDAIFVAVRNGDGTFSVWKDRYDFRVENADEQFVEKRVRETSEEMKKKSR